MFSGSKHTYSSLTSVIRCIIFISLITHRHEVLATNNIQNQLIKRDTVPPSEIFQLKRSDVYVVIVDSEEVKIRLKNDDSITMSRTMFDTLSADIKKEISARKDGIFANSLVAASYIGGPPRWLSFLTKNLHYPVEAQENNIQGTVMVEFHVDSDGNVSNIEVISGPESGGLREETVRIIKKSGKWSPAVWNGYNVSSFKRQPLTFKLGPH